MDRTPAGRRHPAAASFLIYRAYAGVEISEPSAGAEPQRIDPRRYLLTQFGVALHYLRLVVLPVGV